MSNNLMKRLEGLVEELGEGRCCWGHEFISAAVDAMERIEELEAKLAKNEVLLQAGFAEYERKLVNSINDTAP